VVRDFGTTAAVSAGVKNGDQVILNPPVDLTDGRAAFTYFAALTRAREAGAPAGRSSRIGRGCAGKSAALSSFTFIAAHSRARGANDGGRWRRDAS
jgi:hypothetical protein